MRKLLPVFVLFFFACTNQSEKSGGQSESEDFISDTIGRVDIDSSLETNQWVAGNLVNWSEHLQVNGGFSVDSFRLAEYWLEEEDEIVAEKFNPAPDFYDLYGPYLKYSQDSNYIVDLDSYNIILRRSKNGSLEGIEAGPDCQIFLIDRAKGTRERLLFFGPGTYVHEALWQDNETVILFGITEFNDFNSANPVVWKINVEKKIFEKYDYLHQIDVDNWKDYSQRVRFKGVNVK